MTHYRSPIDFSDIEIDGAKTAFTKIKNFVGFADHLLTANNPLKTIKVEGNEYQIEKARQEFKISMDDDFNTAKALAVIFDLIHHGNYMVNRGVDPESMREIRDVVIELCEVLGLKVESGQPNAESRKQEIKKLIDEREDARKRKDFKRADEIRRQLLDQGIILEDTAYGTKWKAQT